MIQVYYVIQGLILDETLKKGIISFMNKKRKNIDFLLVFIFISIASLICSFVYFFIAKNYDIFVTLECNSDSCFEGDQSHFVFVKKNAHSLSKCQDEVCLVNTSCLEDGSCVTVDCSSNVSKFFSGYSCAQ